VRQLIRYGLVIARRDFMAVVATPTFLLFLLTPFLMLGISVASGFGGAYLATGTNDARIMIVIASAADADRITAEDTAVRKRLYGKDGGPPPIRIVAPTTDVEAQQARLLAGKDADVTAILHGTLERPVIVHRPDAARDARFLSLVAEQVLRTARLGQKSEQALSTPDIREIHRNVPTKSRQQSTGTGAVVIMFMLTIMLASQAVGTLAEEKSNKVIEILAASVPLESVFFGKLIGLFGIALVFVAFWSTLAAVGLSIVPASAGLSSFVPVIGTPLFIVFAGCYFAMAFMLLGAIFLGVGAQASTMREIQMLSLPITLFQLIMFGLSMAAAGSPGSGVARFAQIFPFSSPFAMAARGATDPAIWPHLMALAWQLLWVAVTIALGAHFFRYGVLKSGVGPFTALGRILRKQTARGAKSIDKNVNSGKVQLIP
jgi:ABC-2 type transport system permease protein